MSGNTFGQIFRLTTFGESHGPAIGGIIDGCPPGIEIDEAFVANELSERNPADIAGATERAEKDEVEWLSGIFEGKSTGMPISFIVRNRNHNTKDYDRLRDVFRPSHADYSVSGKYSIRDHRGGGRLSGRETVARVVGGAVAKLLLKSEGINVQALSCRIGPVELPGIYDEYLTEQIRKSPVKCPDEGISSKMVDYLESLKETGDTAGGIIFCKVSESPAGLGNPVFDKLSADLAKAMMSIGAAKGFELGSGFKAATMKGSDHNDKWDPSGERLTVTNHSGGIQGGISNGEDICFKVAFKPVSSLMQDVQLLTGSGELRSYRGKGRHDVCIVPRAVAVVEAMAALVIADHFLRQKTNK